MVDAPEKLWMTAEGMGWPGSFRSFRMSDLGHPEDEYPAYVRADLYEQVKRKNERLTYERDVWKSKSDMHYKQAVEARARAEAAERLTGARVVTDAMVRAFIRRSSTAAGDTEACIRAGLEAALTEPAGEAEPVAWEPEWTATGTDTDGDPLRLETRWGDFTGRAVFSRGDRRWGAHINYDGGGRIFDPGTSEETVKRWIKTEIRNRVASEIARATKAFSLYTTPPYASAIREAPKFQLGDRVTKTKGSKWTGRVVGFYSTALTPVGYAVESETETGSVQIYPEAALAGAKP